MAQKSLLITRPFYENPTNYLYHWSEPLIKLAKDKGFEVIDLTREKVVRKEVEGRLKKVNPELVVLNGHGSVDEVFGQDGKTLFVKGENEALLANKIFLDALEFFYHHNFCFPPAFWPFPKEKEISSRTVIAPYVLWIRSALSSMDDSSFILPAKLRRSEVGAG